ncbi:MAG: DUF2520 domain-containing protein [Caldilineae bacterium]|nr:MAG: DUF2520 domain-containing protein [Caldilineae bacterium]
MSQPSPTSTSPLPLRIGVIGAGRVGGAMCLAAHAAGYPVVSIYSRTTERARALCRATGAALAADIAAVATGASFILIAVPDDAIAAVDAAGKDAWQPGSLVVHHSGVHPASVLEHAAAAGACTATLHPLQAVPSAEAGVELFKGSYFGISGHPRCLPVLESFVRGLGGHPLRIDDEAKPLYHAAAVFASNYLVACFAQAVRLLVELGISEEEAAAALLPLARGAVNNLAHPGLPDALTGPLTRGDVGTVRQHLQQLAEYPQTDSLYRQLALAALPIVAEQGRLPAARLEALRRLLAIPHQSFSLSVSGST